MVEKMAEKVKMDMGTEMSAELKMSVNVPPTRMVPMDPNAPERSRPTISVPMFLPRASMMLMTVKLRTERGSVRKGRVGLLEKAGTHHPKAPM
jgi:hypothetical protein